MDLDFKILIPLISVIIGWVLGTLTGFFKTRGENKKLLGKSISKLYYLNQELSVVANYLDKMKVRLSNEEYENHRQKIIERHTLKNEHSIENINELVDKISSISPSLGIDLNHLLEEYIAERKIKFNSTKNNRELYFLMLSVYEVHQDLTIAQMEKILVKLSFRYSPILGFKIKRKLKKGKENLTKEGVNIFDKIYSEVDKYEKPVHNKV